MATKVLLLNEEQVHQKMVRIAFQIIEENFDEKELVLVGIKEGGYLMATVLDKLIKKNSKLKTTVGSISIDKKTPLNSELSLEAQDLEGKSVLLVDDVANTGRTLFYAMAPFQQILPAKIQLAVLVDRKHKAFPVTPDYVGMSLATTMKEHINVVLKGKANVYLS